MKTITYTFIMSLPFNLFTKRLLTSLVLTPAYASVSTGTSMRKENNRTDAIEKGLYDRLHLAFHGDPANQDQASFAKLTRPAN